MPSPAAPLDLPELLARAEWLAGKSVGDLARQLDLTLPANSSQAKGKVGELLERWLGASAGNRDQPDFPQLGVELKTIPMDSTGRVRESTFVCKLDHEAIAEQSWQQSRVWRKLRQVLWIPVQAAVEAAPADRRIGRAVLWRPDQREEAELRDDWQQIVGAICTAGIDAVDARMGRALQLRPKAPNSRQQAALFTDDGQLSRCGPRGFYLRARFTEALLWRATDPSSPSAS
ncbi:MAG: DNA mismatch repair endonuclease MutH [Deltaproteobacteria bacterium]|nr:DNA mismatch repair endonuclease MutH [Deltaproteobacteria bacterium]